MTSLDLGGGRRQWPRTFGQELAVLVVIAGAVTVLFMFVVNPSIGWPAVAPPADLSTLEHIHGNLAAYLVWLVAAWVAAGFSEEFIFRGYLMNRIAAIGRGSVFAWVFAIIVQATVFGLGHLYAGPGVALTVGFGALFSGAYFLIAGRNLWALILAHGIWDSLGVTLIYLTGTPST